MLGPAGERAQDRQAGEGVVEQLPQRETGLLVVVGRWGLCCHGVHASAEGYGRSFLRRHAGATSRSAKSACAERVPLHGPLVTAPSDDQASSLRRRLGKVVGA